MFRIVDAIISPELTGATLPGRERAQTTFNPSLRAVSKSTPPGLEARSIISDSALASFRMSSLSITAGTVFMIRLKFLIQSFSEDVWIP